MAYNTKSTYNTKSLQHKINCTSSGIYLFMHLSQTHGPYHIICCFIELNTRRLAIFQLVNKFSQQIFLTYEDICV